MSKPHLRTHTYLELELIKTMGQSFACVACFSSYSSTCYTLLTRLWTPKKIKHFRFFDLPLELRRQVYKFADSKLLCAGNGVEVPAILKSSIHICREVYQDITLVVVIDTIGLCYPACKTKRYMVKTARTIGRWKHCGNRSVRLRIWVESLTSPRGIPMIRELLKQIWTMPGVYAVASGSRKDLRAVRRFRVLLSITEVAPRRGDLTMVRVWCRRCLLMGYYQLDEMIDTVNSLEVGEWMVRPLVLSDAEDAVYIETQRRRRTVLY